MCHGPDTGWDRVTELLAKWSMPVSHNTLWKWILGVIMRPLLILTYRKTIICLQQSACMIHLEFWLYCLWSWLFFLEKDVVELVYFSYTIHNIISVSHRIIPLCRNPKAWTGGICSSSMSTRVAWLDSVRLSLYTYDGKSDKKVEPDLTTARVEWTEFTYWICSKQNLAIACSIHLAISIASDFCASRASSTHIFKKAVVNMHSLLHKTQKNRGWTTK